MKVVRRPRSLKRQILSRTLVVGLVPLLILTAAALAALWQLSATAEGRLEATRSDETEAEITDRLEAEAVATGRRVALATTDLATVISRWAADPARAVTITDAGTAPTTAVVDPALSSLVQGEADVVSALLTNRSGTVVAVSSTEIAGGDLSDDPAWRTGWIEAQAIGPLRYDDAAADHRLPVAMRVTDDEGLPTGVLIAELDLGYMRRITDLDPSLGLTATIATADGGVLADTASGHDPAIVGVPTVAADRRPGGLDLIDGDADTGSTTSDSALYGFARIVVAGSGTGVGATGEAIDAADAADAEGTAPLDETGWTVVVGQSREDAFGSLASLEEVNDEIATVRQQLTVLMLVVMAFATLVAVAMATLITRQIISPVRELTERMRFAADTGLPRALEQVLNTTDGSPARAADPTVDVERQDELGDLARSFNSVQDSALNLAVDQAAQRRNALAMVANLGRRNQSLVNRQLRHIEELERNEDDPDRLASLFGLDHLATRMRRGAQSFLVLAGHGGASTKLGPVRAEMVVQGALGEVEHYERVTVDHIAPGAIAGHIATDVAHLLAELVENALSCSPPNSTVEVVGELGADAYRLVVIDAGIGMTDDEIAEANDLLASDVDLYRRSTPQLGHVVASKLAARHGLTLWLEANADSSTPSALGIRAIVELPISYVSPAATAPALAGGATVAADPTSKPPAPQHRNTDTHPVVSPSPPEHDLRASLGAPGSVLDEPTEEHPVVVVDTAQAPSAPPERAPLDQVRPNHELSSTAPVAGYADASAALLPPVPDPAGDEPPADVGWSAGWPSDERATSAEPMTLTDAVFEAQTAAVGSSTEDAGDVVAPAWPEDAVPATQPADGGDEGEAGATADASVEHHVDAAPAAEPEPVSTGDSANGPTPQPATTPAEAAPAPVTAAPAAPPTPQSRGTAASPAPSPASTSRYRGEISNQSAAQLTPVTQRRSRRNANPAAPSTRHPADRRAVVTTASDDEVRAEAERIRNRWRSFQQGRRTAQSTEPTPQAPAPERDHR